MEIRLWLDDLRPAPAGWLHAHSAARAIEVLSNGGVSEVSLDHDLGMDGCTETSGGLLIPAGEMNRAGSGYDVAAWIEEEAHAGRLLRLKWSVHSANPVGRSRIVAAMESAERAWSTADRR